MDLDHRVDPNLTREQALALASRLYGYLDECPAELTRTREALAERIRQYERETEPDPSWLVDEK